MANSVLFFDLDDPKSISVTEQSHENACDINKIIARAEKTGLMPVALNRGVFGDFSNVDYEVMQVKIAKANQAFMSLPVSIRNRFRNSVAELLAFIDDPVNLEEAVKLKLLPKSKLPPAKPYVEPAAKPPEPEQPAA